MLPLALYQLLCFCLKKAITTGTDKSHLRMPQGPIVWVSRTAVAQSHRGSLSLLPTCTHRHNMSKNHSALKARWCLYDPPLRSFVFDLAWNKCLCIRILFVLIWLFCQIAIMIKNRYFIFYAKIRGMSWYIRSMPPLYLSVCFVIQYLNCHLVDKQTNKHETWNVWENKSELLWQSLNRFNTSGIPILTRF